MNRNIFIIISLVFAFGVIIFATIISQLEQKESQDTPSQNIVTKDGVQYITINAQGGYTPRITNAQANVPTKLIIKTDNTYDCSSSLVIRSIGYQKMLPPTGEEVIDLGNPKAGAFRGLCSMGMYNFTINFK